MIRFFISFIFLITHLSIAQTYYETKITPFDGTEHIFFGSSISLGNSYLVVGAPNSPSYGQNSGTVYGYKKISNQWIFDQKIKPDDINENDRLSIVKLYADTLFTGAFDKEVYGNIKRGAVYQFVRNDSIWVQVQKIIPLDTLPSGSRFGESFDVNNQFLIISAKLDIVNGIGSGSVYVFKKQNSQWVQCQKLFPRPGVDGSRFGGSIALSDKFLLIGAADETNIIGEYAGAVYVYELIDTIWVEKEKIINRKGSGNEAFGRDVDVSGTSLAVGAPGNIFATFPGSVFIYDFENGNIVLKAELKASDADYDNYFGSNFTIKKDSIIISASGDDEVANSAGALYLFRKENGKWVEKVKLTASDGDVGESLGVSTDMDDGIIVGGASFYDDPLVDNIGAVYIFADKPTGVDSQVKLNPDEFYLAQNYPNPFNPTTTIRYSIGEAGFVSLKVYGILGKEIATLVNEEKPAGIYVVEFNGTELASGIYFYRLQAGDPSTGSGQGFVETKKMVLMK